MERHIDFTDQQINTLVLENSGLMRDIVENMVSQVSGKEGKFVLSNGLKELSLEKNAAIVIDFFSMSLNDRKVLTKLYDRLAELSVNEDFYLKTNEIRTRLEEYISDLLFESDLAVTYDGDFKVQDLFKLLGVKFEENTNGLLEKILAYIELCSGFLGLKLIVFVNLGSYLLREELEKLYEQVKYYGINLLLIEHSLTRDFLPQERVFVVDKDLCEI